MDYQFKNRRTEAEKILVVLTKQHFFDWYNGRFESWLTGEYEKGHPNHISREDILKDIEKMFGIVK